MIVAVSGIRDVGEAWVPVVEEAARRTADLVVQSFGRREMRFGGAIGVDTIALQAVGLVEGLSRVVYVPFTVGDQPRAARRAIDLWATTVVELELRRQKRSYLKRNLAMLDGADRLLAFSDGRTTGGTAFTVDQAKRRGHDVGLVHVARGGSPGPGVVGHALQSFLEVPP